MTTIEAWIWPAGLGLLGLVFGSFIATLAIRWPEGRSVSKGRSECDACGKALGPAELTPVLSYALQRGACRACGARIPVSHPITELVACAIGVTAGWLAPGIEGAFGAMLGWTLLALAALDYAAFWLPNTLTFLLAIGGVAQALLTSLEPPIASRIAGGIAGYAGLRLVAFLYEKARGRQGLGGGDPKMLGALGLWFGVLELPNILLAACLYGLAIVAVAALAKRSISGTTKLPFGVMLALAGWTWWVIVTPRAAMSDSLESIVLVAEPTP